MPPWGTPLAKQSLLADMSREDPTVLLKQILEYCGFTKEPGNPSRFYSIISAFTAVSLGVTYISVVKYVTEDHPFFDKGLSMEASCSIAYLLTKLINVKIRYKLFWKIVNNAAQFWDEVKENGKYLEILENRSVGVNKLAKIIMLLYNVPSILAILISLPSNFIVEPEKREFIYKFWDPFRDTLGEDYFWLRYSYGAVFAGWTLQIFGVALAMLVSCSHMACMQMEVLVAMLQEKKIIVSDCIRLHQRSLMFVRDLNDYFSGLLLLELIFSAVVISLRVYVIYVLWESKDPRVYFEMAYLIVVLMDPYMICYSGQIVTNMSEKVFTSSYQNEWYKLTLEEQKCLSLLMCQASRTLRVQYKSIMRFDRVRFGMFLAEEGCQVACRNIQIQTLQKNCRILLSRIRKIPVFVTSNS